MKHLGLAFLYVVTALFLSMTSAGCGTQTADEEGTLKKEQSSTVKEAQPTPTVAQPTVVQRSDTKAEKTGEELFQQHCTTCHPEGGNVISPEKTLHRKDLEANRIKTAEEIVHLMRNPGPGMLKIDETTISNEEAGQIAEYILDTFK